MFLRSRDVLAVARPAVDAPGDVAVVNVITGGVLVHVTGFSNRVRTKDALLEAGYQVTSLGPSTFTVESPRPRAVLRVVK